MNNRSPRFCRAGLIALAAGLALALVGVLVVWASGAEPASPASMGLQPQQTGTITGTVYYSGTITGTHMVWVGAFTTTQGGPPAYGVNISGTGSYSITGMPEGLYYIEAGMDADDSGGPPNPAVDPLGAYAQNPISVTAGAVITGVDITLLDPTPPPTGTGSISGWISYTGNITTTHNIIVVATREGEQSPAYFAVISSAGSYSITNMADYTYTVFAFMDLGDDMGPPQPGEPGGWYDPGRDGAPDLVVISGGSAVTGIDILLHDPLYFIYYYIYLPSILKE